ncbi:MAG: phospholipase D-like domain-containing protein [Candidatus Micrarchaeaceae archaeon]|jgi:phosphatidylserine/phosphatidylglycerophosphate/cardiolipin synthase-like enzyme
MFDQNKDSYSGESSYTYVDKLVKNKDKELMIISPYISNYYTRMLLKQANSKRIRVITSESSMSYRDSKLSKLVVSGIKGYIKAIIFLIILDIISIYLQFNYTTIALSAIILILSLFSYLRHKNQKRNLQVKVIRNKFVHEKMYIAKDTAIIGSANLTYKGMHKNVEHIEIIRDKEKINSLKTHFEEMWRNN